MFGFSGKKKVDPPRDGVDVENIVWRSLPHQFVINSVIRNQNNQRAGSSARTVDGAVTG